MKKIFLIYLMLVLGYSMQAQNEMKDVSSWKVREVKVGERMPDIPLGTVVNNYTGKKQFFDFKGKLIILDFWDTHCKACIAAFPHMSALQKEFRDQIQIFLVNHFETQAEIEASLSKYYKNKKILLPSNLPSIVSTKHGDNVLNKMFPPKGETGYHVWIDGEGIVRLRGPGFLNTYEEKIKDLLAGKEIGYVSDENVKTYVNVKGSYPPFYSLLSKVPRPIIQYNSVITKFTDEIGSPYGNRFVDKVDSATGTLRNTIFNVSIIDLYLFAATYHYRELLDEWTRRLLNDSNPNMGRRSKQEIGKRFMVLGPHPSAFSEGYLPEGAYNDKWIRENTFCYEQIAPISISDSLRRQYMLGDHNRYFGALYGMEGRIENVKKDCYLLVRTSQEDKLKTQSESGTITTKKIQEKGRAMVAHGNKHLKDIISGYAVKLPDPEFSIPLLDETNYTGKVDMILPEKINSLEELRQALLRYDLDIVKGERECRMLVIREVKGS